MLDSSAQHVCREPGGEQAVYSATGELPAVVNYDSAEAPLQRLHGTTTDQVLGLAWVLQCRAYC